MPGWSKEGGIRFGVGPLAHLLKNRFYIGEVHYRGEVYRGEHEPILGRDLFEAVQAKLAANAVDRQGSDELSRDRTGLCQQSNQSPLPGNGNWKIASRDRRPKPASKVAKCRKLLTRDRCRRA